MISCDFKEGFNWITDWDTIYSKTFQAKWLDWSEIAQNTHVFFHPSLCIAWVETYRPLRNLQPLFCVFKKNEVLIFLPLVIWKKNWKNVYQKVIVPVGYSDFDYHDPLIIGNVFNEIDKSLFYEQLLTNLKSNFSFDKIEINGLRVSNSKLLVEEQAVAPFSDLSMYSDENEFIMSLKTKLRGDLKRQIRRLSEKGTLNMVVHNEKTVWASGLENFLKHHSKRWPNAYKAPSFHDNLVNYSIGSGIVQFSELTVNNETISWHLGFINNDVFYYYMPAANFKWEKYSPGKVHLLMLVNFAINKKFKKFDHLKGEENYKKGWTENIQKLYKLEYDSKSLSSRFKMNLVNLKQKLL